MPRRRPKPRRPQPNDSARARHEPRTDGRSRSGPHAVGKGRLHRPGGQGTPCGPANPGSQTAAPIFGPVSGADTQRTAAPELAPVHGVARRSRSGSHDVLCR